MLQNQQEISEKYLLQEGSHLKRGNGNNILYGTELYDDREWLILKPVEVAVVYCQMSP